MNNQKIDVCFRWSLIAGRLPGRTDNEIKNYWNTHIRRKLLSRGIDPATHRPLNDSTSASHNHNIQEQQQQQPSSLVAATTTTISFASSASASAAVKQEQDTITTTLTTTSATCNANMFGIMEKNNNIIKDYSMERCPDLNLELTISPPRHLDEPDHHKFSGIERALCFVCSLGLQNSKDCRCGYATANANVNGSSNSNGNTTTTTTTTASAGGYDFLGLKTGSVWDYRSLEMK
ncbi:hypothetical protein PIB30_076173 [Stylosanthes scabra]|uniref:Uncharacterized protein n=1 Tax=Stylosanthes scabra TaxID=79078 RepID=A0ABU6SQK6_9FABA|nr:hypothetical protein [Stylosanthes scabra]